MRILLFSDLELPDSCALATRVINFAKLIRMQGHEVDLLGVNYEGDTLQGSYDGIEYRMLKAGEWRGVKAYKRIRALSKDIKNYLSTCSKYDVILLSNVYFDLAKTFIDYSKHSGASLIVNSVEWYDRKVSFPGLKGKIKLVKNRIALKYLHVKMRNIVAISSWLGNYYKKRNCNVVVIPAIINVDEYKSAYESIRVRSNIIRIAYAGVPGKKDYIENVFRALELLSDEERTRICIDLYGPSVEQLRPLLSENWIEKYKDNIICHGRIPHADVKKKIAAADFTVLLRPNKRYANAGFPTKVGESMACGTPVIANITSDLGKYIIDGKTGIVCRDETPEACADALRRTLALTDEEKEGMRKAAWNMANAAFDYRAYVEVMENFLSK